jgi:hypothetical protein
MDRELALKSAEEGQPSATLSFTQAVLQRAAEAVHERLIGGCDDSIALAKAALEGGLRNMRDLQEMLGATKAVPPPPRQATRK